MYKCGHLILKRVKGISTTFMFVKRVCGIAAVFLRGAYRRPLAAVPYSINFVSIYGHDIFRSIRQQNGALLGAPSKTPTQTQAREPREPREETTPSLYWQ